MATTTSPPPKPQGAKGFVVAALVMLVLTVGLLYFKLSGNKAPPPKSQPAAAVKPPAPKRLEHAPPPPPPVLPEASVPDKKTPVKKVQRAVRASPGSCGGECQGKVTPVLKSALHAKGFQGRGCYERALLQNPVLAGRLSIQVRVGTHGQVCSARVAADSIGDPSVAACVLQLFRSARLPPPSTGCVDVQVPLNFVTKT